MSHAELIVKWRHDLSARQLNALNAAMEEDRQESMLRVRSAQQFAIPASRFKQKAADIAEAAGFAPLPPVFEFVLENVQTLVCLVPKPQPLKPSPKLVRVRVEMKTVSSDGFSAVTRFASHHGHRPNTAPESTLVDAIDELARLTVLYQCDDAAIKAFNDAVARTKEGLRKNGYR